MSIIHFPKKRSTISAALRISALTKPCEKIEAKVVIEGELAETVTVLAGNAQKPVEAFIVGALRAMFGGERSA